MEQIEIGNSEIVSSRVGLGTWAIGGWMWGGTDDKEAIATIRAALDRGISLIDTAPVYGFGRSEEIVGQAITGARDRVVIATKCGMGWKDGNPYRDSRPASLRKGVEDSLRRLNVDTIDLMQVHWPDLETPIEDAARTLAQLKREGKIRAIGVSNYTPEQMDRFRKEAPLVSIQPPYNLFERETESGVLPYAERTRLTLLCYGALCRGLLSGRMTAHQKFEGDDLRNVDPKFVQPRFDQYLASAEALKSLARQRFGKSLLALAVRWVLDQGPTIALWGARHPGQIDPVDEIDGWTIDDDTKAEIDRILADKITDPATPEFMAPPLKRPSDSTNVKPSGPLLRRA